MKYIVLRRSELGKKEYDYFERPLFFDTKEEAEKACQEWQDFLAGYPCNGDAVIARVCE